MEDSSVLGFYTAPDFWGRGSELAFLVHKLLTLPVWLEADHKEWKYICASAKYLQTQPCLETIRCASESWHDGPRVPMTAARAWGQRTGCRYGTSIAPTPRDRMGPHTWDLKLTGSDAVARGGRRQKYSSFIRLWVHPQSHMFSHFSPHRNYAWNSKLVNVLWKYLDIEAIPVIFSLYTPTLELSNQALVSQQCLC